MNTIAPSRTAIFVRITGFLMLFAILQLGWEFARGGSLEYVLIHDATVRPAAVLINFLTPNVQVRAVDFTLYAQGGGLNISNGCEGFEALFLLIAAFAVAPLSWGSRAAGVLLGVAFVYVVNQLRILALFYAYRWDHSWFDPLHATVTPIAVVLLVAAFFYAWLFKAHRHAVAA